MSKCPLCHAPLKDDFGLLECPGCGAQLIVHMDGRAEYHGEANGSVPIDEDEPEEGAESAHAELPHIEEIIREIEFDLDGPPRPPEDRAVVQPSSEGAQDLVAPGGADLGDQMPEDDVYDAARDYAAEIANISSDREPSDDNEVPYIGEVDPAMEQSTGPVGGGDEGEEAFPDFDGAQPSSPEAVYNPAPLPSSPDLGDVARFGNSELSGGREGPLRYNLFIEGIDTVDVRESFREAITDRKLIWDVDQILRSVRNGRVSIQNVAPTKAYILITRLRAMPVQVRWEQYAISQT